MVLESFCQFDVNFTHFSVSTVERMKKISAVKRRVPKNTQTLHKTINPHPNIFPNTPFQLQHPDPNKTSTIKTVPNNIKDSAINVCTLNI